MLFIISFNIADIVIIFTAYLVGSISTGYWLVKFQKSRDIRSYGSGNIGAKNVGRLLGRTGFIITFFGDAFKAVIAVKAAQYLSFPLEIICLVAFAVVAGHIWPLFLRFQGGKGIATALGSFLSLDYSIILIVLTIFLIIFALVRNINISGFIAIISAPIILFLLNFNAYILITFTTCVLIILFAHRSNIRKVIHGKKDVI